MTNEERCWQTGYYNDDTFCECCSHQSECSGNDKTDYDFLDDDNTNESEEN